MSREVKKQAYLALVRPHLEYASSAWDPHLQKHIQQIEMVQRRAACFIKSNYSRDPGTVTTLLEQLELPPLSTRRKIARITLLHKAIHEKVAIPIPSYIIKPTRTSRFHHPKRYIQIRPKKDVYKYSFFPRTIRDWNQLSDFLLDIESSEEFKSRLTKLYYGGWTTWTIDDDFILILITCKYTHFWDFTVYTNNFVMLEWWINNLFQVNTIDR